jgi:membrane-bound lytic murein transglycosylase A
VAEAFQSVIDQRADQGLSVHADFVGVREVSLVNASSTGTSGEGEMTVRFVGELTSVVRNEDGEIVEGNPNEIKRQRDVWTFSRMMGWTIRTGTSSPPGNDRASVRGGRGRGSLAVRPWRTVSHAIVGWDRLDGWTGDDHEAALSAFLVTCGDLDGNDWRAVCAEARGSRGAARAFFERAFRPVLDLGRQAGALHRLLRARARRFAGPHRPCTATRSTGSRPRSAGRPVAQPGRDRDAAPSRGARAGDRLAFRSGRGLLPPGPGVGAHPAPDGRAIRVGFGGRNGHPYRSIGTELVRRGIFEPHQVSAQGSSAGCARTRQGRRTSASQPVLHLLPRGERGAARPRAARCDEPLGDAPAVVAVDPEFVPLGAPVWIEKAGGSRCAA